MSYRYDRDSVCGGRPTKLLNDNFGTNIKNLSFEINLRKRKWFFK